MRFVLTAALILGLGSAAVAGETVTEGAEATVNDLGREAKKAGHRVDEALCTKGDVACAGKKAKHRAVETKDKVKDKTKEAVNKVD